MLTHTQLKYQPIIACEVIERFQNDVSQAWYSANNIQGRS